MRALAIALLLAAAARAADPAAPWAARVRAFFDAEGPCALADPLAALDAPALDALPFGRVEIDGETVAGWIEAEGRIRTGLFAVRRFEGGVDALHRHTALAGLAQAAEPPVSALLAHWVAALRADDAKGARRAWWLLARDRDAAGLRTALLRALAAEWPLAWEEGRRPDAAARALRAMEVLAGDAYWRAYVRRRRAYVEECADTIPDPPSDDAPPERAVRPWIEGLRRMGPVYSCLIGTPPHFYGEPDALVKLKEIGAPAFPALVIAAEDPRTAGRSVSLGGEGEPSSVAYVASCLLRDMLPYAEDGETMERWIQGGTWQDARATARWFAAHGTRPDTLVAAAAALQDVAGAEPVLRPLLDHAAAPVRVAAAAALGAWDGLAACADAVPALEAEVTWYGSSPERIAVSAWTIAVSRHGARGWRLYARALARGEPGTRIALLVALVHPGVGRAPVPLVAPYLDDDNARVRLAAAIVLDHLSGDAIGHHSEDDALVAAARAWARGR